MLQTITGAALISQRGRDDMLQDKQLQRRHSIPRCAARLQVMDYGFPQFTEAKILSEYIKTDAYKMEVSLTAFPRLQKQVLPALSPLSVH